MPVSHHMGFGAMKCQFGAPEALRISRRIHRLSVSLASYLELLDWTGRQLRSDKVGAIPSHLQPILTRIGLDKRQSQTGERRLASNPFDGFGKRDEKNDRKRIARAMTLNEMQRLLDIAQRRPLEDAQTIRTGPRQGELGANVTKERQAALERLGTERALIYKTLILTGLRANELRTLRIGNLSFGDVPFLVLRASNEKNRKGSTVPIKSDLAADLRVWSEGKTSSDLVFNVPTGLLRILNRDLVAADIDKMDENEGRIHLHAMRHSTGTHLSAAGVSPRTAQAVMRHSDIALTMNTYTDEKLLQTSAAVELLPELPIGTKRTEAESLVAPAVAPASYKRSQNGSEPDKMAAGRERPQERENPVKHKDLRGFDESGRQDLNLRPLRPESTDDFNRTVITGFLRAGDTFSPPVRVKKVSPRVSPSSQTNGRI